MIRSRMSRQNKFVFAFLSVFFLATAILAFLSTGTYESGDSIQHYLIAHYSFKHPELFLDDWGKPFFTLLSSPFAQIGFFGICLFNIMCGALTGFIAYRTALLFGWKNSWLAPLFALFAPIYYVTLISGLTEPLFGLVLMTGVYFTVLRKPTIAAIVVSFLLFVRSEGFLLLPLFAISFLLLRNLISCFLLLTGPLVYSFIGYFKYHTFFWILTENPYTGAKEIYGTGDLFHFLARNEFIWGTPLVVLFIIGFLTYFFRPKESAAIELLLIPGVFYIYLLAHSLFWWKGLFGSLGLIRVIAGIMPLSGLIALKGFNLLMEFISKIKWRAIPLIRIVLTVIICGLVVLMPFKQHRFPRDLGYEDEVIKEAATWLKQNQPGKPKIYHLFPYLCVFLQTDPFDENKYEPLWALKTSEAPGGSIIVWDSHYCPNEGKMGLDLFAGKESLELLNSFKADSSKIPADKQPFEVYVFRKKIIIPPKKTGINLFDNFTFWIH